mgnify:CR=1 FL=1
MNETLRLLYDKFYTPLPMVESEQEVETCHRQLIERLDKPERKLVLQIIDAHVDAHLKDYDISDDLSMNLEPLVDYTYVPTLRGNRPVFGFNLSLNF